MSYNGHLTSNISQNNPLALYMQHLRCPPGLDQADEIIPQTSNNQYITSIPNSFDISATKFQPQSQYGRAYQQTPFSTLVPGAIPQASEFFPPSLRTEMSRQPRGMGSNGDDDWKPEVSESHDKSVGDFLLKSAVFIHKAYDALLPKSAEAANQLAKVSNDILKIYTELFDSDLESIPAVNSEPPELRAPACPPGLFKSTEDALTRAESAIKPRMPDVIPQEVLGKTKHPASQYLELEPEANTMVDVFQQALGPWAQASEQMDAWDESVRSTTISTSQSGLDNNTSKSTTQNASKLTQEKSVVSGSPTSSLASAPKTVSTWAKVAAINPQPGTENKLAPTINLITSAYEYNADVLLPAISEAIVQESYVRQQRLVYVRGCNKVTQLKDITKHINEGPIMSILLEKDPSYTSLSACIIFMDAANARNFVEKNDNSAKRTGHTLYGQGIQVAHGDPWPEDDEVRAMTARRERRRLTFSAGSLFQRVSRDMFKADVTAIAGEANIELLWLFNTGNATVVFASVRVARAVKCRFIAQAKEKDLYDGLRISYSSDPCERELNLVTQMLTGPERAMATTVKRG